MTARMMVLLVAAMLSIPAAASADASGSERERPTIHHTVAASPSDGLWRERLALRNERHDQAYAGPAVEAAGHVPSSRTRRGVPLAAKPFYRPSTIVPGPAVGF